MSHWLEIERSNSPLVLRLHDYWHSLRGSREVPDRGDLDPADLKLLLPNILISEPSFNPFRVRYRLVGTRITRTTGFDFTGRYLDEVLRPEIDEDWHGHYRLCHDRRIPVYGQTTAPTKSGGDFTYEFGIFPLRRSGETVAQFIAIEDFGAIEPYSVQFQDDRS